MLPIVDSGSKKKGHSWGKNLKIVDVEALRK